MGEGGGGGIDHASFWLLLKCLPSRTRAPHRQLRGWPVTFDKNTILIFFMEPDIFMFVIFIAVFGFGKAVLKEISGPHN